MSWTKRVVRASMFRWLGLAAEVVTLASLLGACVASERADSSDAGFDASHALLDASVDASRTTTDSGARDASRMDASRAPDVGVTAADAGAPEPTLATDTASLGAALHCPAQFVGNYDPVLLVHGTGANAAIAWSWGYEPVLTARGFDVCTLDLPAYSWEDAQIASEYVVHAIRTIAARTAQRVSVIAHSQGTLEVRWALRWWPSLRSKVGDVIGLAGVDHGTPQADQSCSLLPCRVADQQMRPGSKLIAALNASFETAPGVDYSSIFSTTDPTAVAPTSVVSGARTFAIQSLCPGRDVGHAAMTSDAVVYAAVLDALLHEGPLDPARLPSSVCGDDRAPGIDPALAEQKESEGSDLFLSTYFDGRWVASEPALAPYAR